MRHSSARLICARGVRMIPASLRPCPWRQRSWRAALGRSGPRLPGWEEREQSDQEIHREEFVHLVDLSHDRVLIAWGAFWFRRDEADGRWNILDDSELQRPSVGVRASDTAQNPSETLTSRCWTPVVRLSLRRTPRTGPGSGWRVSSRTRPTATASGSTAASGHRASAGTGYPPRRAATTSGREAATTWCSAPSQRRTARHRPCGSSPWATTESASSRTASPAAGNAASPTCSTSSCATTTSASCCRWATTSTRASRDRSTTRAAGRTTTGTPASSSPTATSSPGSRCSPRSATTTRPTPRAATTGRRWRTTSTSTSASASSRTARRWGRGCSTASATAGTSS